ncbi:hypothetical protein F5Y18DRAFT_401643 [Xylariaceae sp. FL1019]|nr:hypothetical protein F5Y18DRAFT_401643 [Xylariaceae sp. FL1019]
MSCFFPLLCSVPLLLFSPFLLFFPLCSSLFKVSVFCVSWILGLWYYRERGTSWCLKCSNPFQSATTMRYSRISRSSSDQNQGSEHAIH